MSKYPMIISGDAADIEFVHNKYRLWIWCKKPSRIVSICDRRWDEIPQIVNLEDLATLGRWNRWHPDYHVVGVRPDLTSDNFNITFLK